MQHPRNTTPAAVASQGDIPSLATILSAAKADPAIAAALADLWDRGPAPTGCAAVRRQPERPRPRHDARVLTEGGPEAEIMLDGVRYVLRITRQGKLILTK